MTGLQNDLVDRIWARDVSAFMPAGAPNSVADSVRQRLGWLDAPQTMLAHLDTLASLAREIQADGITAIYLLGMGGSSLSAEVLRDIQGKPGSSQRLVVLDTTDEAAIHRTTRELEPASSLFIVASKSGSTIEVSALEAHFWSVMSAAVGSNAGRHFVAITDPETALVNLAERRGYRRTLVNPPDIGGRYSVLSLFGLVPAALAGLNASGLLESGQRMAERCRARDAANPGFALGAFMAEAARSGRDKLTLLSSSVLSPLGVWIEQLVAESTGKDGRGVLPIVDEPLGAASSYGSDRAFVVIRDADTGELADLARALARDGHPIFEIETSGHDLGGEFFRWEFATAVAGALLGVNPFDEPNVRAAKTRTEAQLDARRTTSAFRIEPPFADLRGQRLRSIGTLSSITRGQRQYVAVLDYLPWSRDRGAAAGRLRATIRDRTGVATTHGVGPRYLHSTGQYHKGGPDTGVFLLLTSADLTATPVPGTDYTFSVLKLAQALGDFDALAAAGRRVIHLHFDGPPALGDAFDRVLELLLSPEPA